MKQTNLERNLLLKKINVFQIFSISKLLAVGQFEIIVSGLKFSCTHPFTNNGEIDYECMVISVSNFEKFDIWIFRGWINVQEFCDRLKDPSNEVGQLSRLVRIYWAVLFRVSLMRVFGRI